MSQSELLRELEQDVAMLRAAVDQITDLDQRRTNLAKAVAARFGALEEKLHTVVALLPREPGRPLEENPESFRQKVKMLHEELGWGRPKILAAMRDEAATEWMVRRALTELAGEKSGSRQGHP